MGDALLKYDLFIESQSNQGFFLESAYKNSKNEAAASRIFIR